jgi:putative tryptophan/tyrosine transport system substrate-binding protein
MTMKRRDFITLLGGAAAAWPLAARAQQAERVRRIGVLMSVAADGPQGQARLAAFVKGLEQLGWTDGRNVQIDTRWGGGDAERTRKYVASWWRSARLPGQRRSSRGGAAR